MGYGVGYFAELADNGLHSCIEVVGTGRKKMGDYRLLPTALSSAHSFRFKLRN